jgi:hypothetical protein
VEAQPDPAEDLGSALSAIEDAVAAGGDDLGPLGFWRLVGRVKRDPAAIETYADRIGRVDRIVFERNVRPRVPVVAGNAILAATVVVGALLVVWAHRPPPSILGFAPSSVAGVACVAAAVAWSVGLHSPAHWVVGRLAGIGFTSYFLGGPFPPRPGLKTDYGTYLRTPPRARARFHASGAIATKLAPFLVLLLSPWETIPWWAIALLVAIGVVQIVTDLLFSVRSGDWKKVRRELGVARDLERARGA